MQHAQHICVQIAQKTIWGSPHVRCPPLRGSIFNSDKYILFFFSTYRSSIFKNKFTQKQNIYFFVCILCSNRKKFIWYSPHVHCPPPPFVGVFLTVISSTLYFFFYLLPIFPVLLKIDSHNNG